MANQNCKPVFLIVMDFDNTIIEEDCDTYIQKLAPNSKIPHNIEEFQDSHGWTQYMEEVFKFLFSVGVNKEELLACLKDIPLSPGIREFITKLSSDADFIVISDSNSVFINYVLESKGLSGFFKEIFTNPARFDKNGQLHISQYHEQDWCDASMRNLCKGQVLSDFVQLQAENGKYYSRIAYIGDGMNDFCPSRCLRTVDVVFPRKGYDLLDQINNLSEHDSIDAEVVPWSDATQILGHVRSWNNCKEYPIIHEKVKSPKIMGN